MVMSGRPVSLWTAEERGRLLSANGGAISAEFMDTLKEIYLTHLVDALRPYQAEDGLPRHIPMPVDADGGGPTDKSDENKMVCWCTDPVCWLNMSLRHQEIITMRWAADLMENMGYSGTAISMRADANNLEKEYGLDR